MSRIKTDKLHDALMNKKECYAIRVTTFVRGSTKNRFLEDCIKRECNESKMAALVVATYYEVLDTFPNLKDKEPNAIKAWIIDRIKLE